LTVRPAIFQTKFGFLQLFDYQGVDFQRNFDEEIISHKPYNQGIENTLMNQTGLRER